MEKHHDPVLMKESIDLLIKNIDGQYFEGTLGFGGHTEEILSRLSSKGVIVSTDVDKEAFEFSSKKFEGEERIRLYNFNFDKIDIISKIENIPFFDGVFADLGVSSFQLDNAESGFSFRMDAPLDMRMNKDIKLSAADVLNSYPEEQIANIIYEFGEEKNSRKIAKLIVEKRKEAKFVSTKDLYDVIIKTVPPNFLNKTLMRVFQALRIFINEELIVLEVFLKKAIEVVKPGGRIVIISYHSLEDRIVKEFFKYEALDCICPKEFPICQCDKEARVKVITRKPIIPSDDEIKSNRRARSAKMRVVEVL